MRRKNVHPFLHLDKALSHADRERLDKDANVGVEVLNADSPHKASLLLFLGIPVSVRENKNNVHFRRHTAQ